MIYQYYNLLIHLTHSLVFLASSTDPGVGDVEVSPVHLSTPLIAHYRQVDRLQNVFMSSTWKSFRFPH